MVTSNPSKGKKRAIEETRASSSSLSPVPEDIPKPKKSKRAQTKQCPVCDEQIPVRLLGAHAVLESQRVDAIINQVGSTEIAFDDIDDIPGPSSRIRRSAVKARKSMSVFKTGTDPTNSLQQAEKTIQTIKRHRRQRLAKFREMFREEEESNLPDKTKWNGVEVSCPICRATVRGDQDVVDAHVDACLADESRRVQEERQHALQHQRALESSWDEDDHPDDAAGHVGNVRGTGFHRRSHRDEDVDEELDIEGDGGFGEPQFTEGDILPVDHPRQTLDENVDVEIGIDEEDEIQREQKTLRDLVAEGKLVRSSSQNRVDPIEPQVQEGMDVLNTEELDLAILAARKRGGGSSLIIALEAKLKQLETRLPSSTASLCRICLDPYNEPTISTGCWHTCCKECWLRCLGSTKLCPICKRITGATDLRRIYL